LALLAAAFSAGLLIARISTDSPLWGIVVATVVMIVALYFVFAPLLHTWPFRNSGRFESAARRKRVGYEGLPGSSADLSKAKFGDGLDTSIRNAGDVDASEANIP
jgi:hypothetical protein